MANPVTRIPNTWLYTNIGSSIEESIAGLTFPTLSDILLAVEAGSQQTWIEDRYRSLESRRVTVVVQDSRVGLAKIAAIDHEGEPHITGRTCGERGGTLLAVAY